MANKIPAMAVVDDSVLVDGSVVTRGRESAGAVGVAAVAGEPVGGAALALGGVTSAVTMASPAAFTPVLKQCRDSMAGAAIVVPAGMMSAGS